MDQNKIKRYLESLKNNNLNITNTNTIITQNTFEDNTITLTNTIILTSSKENLHFYIAINILILP